MSICVWQAGRLTDIGVLVTSTYVVNRKGKTIGCKSVEKGKKGKAKESLSTTDSNKKEGGQQGSSRWHIIFPQVAKV